MDIRAIKIFVMAAASLAVLASPGMSLAQDRGGKLWLDPADMPRAAEAYCWQLDDTTPEGCNCAAPVQGGLAQNVASPSLKRDGDDIFFWQDEERLLPNPGRKPPPRRPGRAYGASSHPDFERL